MAGLSTAAIIFLILMLIFLIIMAVFIGLYIRARSLLVTCQVNLSGFTCPACATCPSCPACPVCPTGTTGGGGGNGTTCATIASGSVRMTVSGTSKGEELVMLCPVNTVINDYQVLTQVVDTGGRPCEPVDISSYINPINSQSFAESTAKILKQAGIDPHVDYDSRRKIYPTRVVYANYACGQALPTTGMTTGMTTTGMTTGTNMVTNPYADWTQWSGNNTNGNCAGTCPRNRKSNWSGGNWV